MSLEFRGEVWTKYINLGVISAEMLVKAMKLAEIIKGVGVGRKEGKKKIQELSPGEDQT